MHFNLHPLKLYRANRVMDFGDGWLTRIGEVLLLPDVQKVRDLEKLGAVEEVKPMVFAAENAEGAEKIREGMVGHSTYPRQGPHQELDVMHGGPRKGWLKRWLEKFIR